MAQERSTRKLYRAGHLPQMEATDALDITKETKETQVLYGADKVHGRQLLIARRLIERGVRVVGTDGWSWDIWATRCLERSLR